MGKLSVGEFIEGVKKNYKEKLTTKEATELVAAVIETIKENLETEGSSVGFSEFGVFKVTKRSARKGRNPKTGEAVDVPEKLSIKFKSKVRQ
jgi:nucleoid DNA-binding protein